MEDLQLTYTGPGTAEDLADARRPDGTLKCAFCTAFLRKKADSTFICQRCHRKYEETE